MQNASNALALPWWSALPFVSMLLAIAMLPLLAPSFWEHNRNRAWVSALCGVPVLIAMLLADRETVLHTAHEYVAFVILLGSLYVITGNIVVRGSLVGTPGVNTSLLVLGSALASCIGTTGASMLLIRPVLRANRWRERSAHVVVFFIFMVSNIGGLLTPLGDPPLFLGFLRGVPFVWTLRFWPVWLSATAILAVVFYGIDNVMIRREKSAAPRRVHGQLSVVGRHNVLFLAGLVALIVLSAALGAPPGVQELGMAGLAWAAWRTTAAALREENHFSWAPMAEVAILFAGIFASMMPALALLNTHGAALGLQEPWQFFWSAGVLSSVLDNAPTYLTFTTAATALLGGDAQNLMTLVASPRGARLLEAISLGAVMMGANTYIGNGPNFMVKAVAEEHGVRMPSFFGYLACSVVVLGPVFVLVTFVFL